MNQPSKNHGIGLQSWDKKTTAKTLGNLFCFWKQWYILFPQWSSTPNPNLCWMKSTWFLSVSRLPICWIAAAELSDGNLPVVCQKFFELSVFSQNISGLANQNFPTNSRAAVLLCQDSTVLSPAWVIRLESKWKLPFWTLSWVLLSC